MAEEVIYRVFVSSTFDDLKDERLEVQKSLLKMDCLPVGMELFPSTDEETWEFIKRQVEASDFYLLVIAGRYGTVAEDGRSFTEKEYDYAIELGKPILAFLHADPDKIIAGKSERDTEKLKKLQDFKAKCKSKKLVTFYNNAHELGAFVLSSVLELKRRLQGMSPRVGYIRISDSVDHKRYSEVLEENRQLKSDIENILKNEKQIFGDSDELVPIKTTLYDNDLSGSEQRIGSIATSVTWSNIFYAVADAILHDDGSESSVIRIASASFFKNVTRGTWTRWDGPTFDEVKRKMFGFGLIIFRAEDRTGGITSRAYRDTVWYLTAYGQEQYGIVMRLPRPELIDAGLAHSGQT